MPQPYLKGALFICHNANLNAACKKGFLHSSITGVEINFTKKRCITQSVLIVEKTVKFHSSLTQADPFTVEIAIQNEHQQEEDSKLSQQL